MVITFRCGHAVTVPDTYQATPRCAACGDQVVSRVQVRAPRFVGTVRGPYAQFEALGAIPVRLAKEPDHDR